MLNSQYGMSPAPGQLEEARMVFSDSGKRLHLVLPSKGGRFKCDFDCMNFISLGIIMFRSLSTLTSETKEKT